LNLNQIKVEYVVSFSDALCVFYYIYSIVDPNTNFFKQYSRVGSNTKIGSISHMRSSLCYLALESDIALISNTVSTTKGALMGKVCTPYTNLTWPVFGPKI